jgi:3-methyladenine DNA glycosylase AlkD
VVRKIGRGHYVEVRALSKLEIFDLCEQLLAQEDWRLRTIAFAWAFKQQREYVALDFDRFERWLARYIKGWGSCDDFCTHAFGSLLYQFPTCASRIRAWTTSESRWFRRAAAVVQIYGLRRGRAPEEAFVIADRLLTDADDLVQKGYGWMLKEASKRSPRRVFDYVMAHKDVMPRTALRYAIEKLDAPLREQAMAK